MIWACPKNKKAEESTPLAPLFEAFELAHHNRTSNVEIPHWYVYIYEHYHLTYHTIAHGPKAVDMMLYTKWRDTIYGITTE